jgi:hypothetical protein
MPTRQTQPKAIALISGGLDSLLAARVVKEQGVHVEGINYFTGFCVEGHTHAIRNRDRTRHKRNNALWSAEQLGIQLHIVDVIDAYKDVVINPKHGYGANLNPCLDCKPFMVTRARGWTEDMDIASCGDPEPSGRLPGFHRTLQNCIALSTVSSLCCWVMLEISPTRNPGAEMQASTALRATSSKREPGEQSSSTHSVTMSDSFVPRASICPSGG